MSLYNEWTDMVVDYVKKNGEPAFWDHYGAVEKKIYVKLLTSHSTSVKGNLKKLAAEYETTPIFFIGFLDGINDSLLNQLNLETLEEDTEIDATVDLEKLYFNMLDAKADYLYNLPQWDAIFSIEKRKEIQKSWRASKTVVNTNKVGRNDPCPCGSGKKYKKCCGK